MSSIHFSQTLLDGNWLLLLDCYFNKWPGILKTLWCIVAVRFGSWWGQRNTAIHKKIRRINDFWFVHVLIIPFSSTWSHGSSLRKFYGYCLPLVLIPKNGDVFHRRRMKVCLNALPSCFRRELLWQETKPCRATQPFLSRREWCCNEWGEQPR